MTKSPLSRNFIISRLGKNGKRKEHKKEKDQQKKSSAKEQSRVIRHKKQKVSDCRVQETSVVPQPHHKLLIRDECSHQVI